MAIELFGIPPFGRVPVIIIFIAWLALSKRFLMRDAF